MLRLSKQQSNVINPWSNVFATVFASLVSMLVMGLLTACASAAASQPAPALTPTPVTNAGEKLTIETVETSNSVTEYTYEIVDEFPHDPAAFTQGLIFTDGIFYEGTGLYGQSTLRKVDPETGEVLMGARLPDEVFGEGIVLFDNKIYQLTWREQIGYIVDAETFEVIDTFTYSTEGWGLTHDGEQLIMSVASERLMFLDPVTLEMTSSIHVEDEDGPITQLNELEFIDGQIYANIWQTDTIVIIDPASGQVTGRIDLTGLLAAADRTESTDVLNGIAYDEESNRLFVTGKFWPTIFEINLVEFESIDQ